MSLSAIIRWEDIPISELLAIRREIDDIVENHISHLESKIKAAEEKLPQEEEIPEDYYDPELDALERSYHLAHDRVKARRARFGVVTTPYRVSDSRLDSALPDDDEIDEGYEEPAHKPFLKGHDESILRYLDKEIEEYMMQEPKSGAALLDADLDEYIRKRPVARPVTSPKRTATSPKRTERRKKTALERLQKLKPGWVLDVSSLEEDGTGVKAVHRPGPSSKKRGPPGIPVVSSSKDNFVKFVRQLPADYWHFIAEY